MKDEKKSSPSSSARFEAGMLLRGKYRVERVLGEGGMGVVLLAMHIKLDQRVAIKVLSPSAKGRGQLIARFAREARAAAKLRNEHVVRVLDVDETDTGDPFLVMEYLVGADLETRLLRYGPLEPGLAVDYVLQACAGVAEAHAAGIIHRDLKPANLFVAREDDGATEIVKVLDFGIAKAASDDEQLSLTSTNATVGSPLYMSPEQLKGTRSIDARADIWSLGVVLYQLASGKLPFEATSATGLAAIIASEEPRPLRELRTAGDLPDAYVDAVERCLRKSPEERFPSVVELARALAEISPEKSKERVARIVRAAGSRKAELAATDPDLALFDPPPQSKPLKQGQRQQPRVTSDLESDDPVVGTSAHAGADAAAAASKPARVTRALTGDDNNNNNIVNANANENENDNDRNANDSDTTGPSRGVASKGSPVSVPMVGNATDYGSEVIPQPSKPPPATRRRTAPVLIGIALLVLASGFAFVLRSRLKNDGDEGANRSDQRNQASSLPPMTTTTVVSIGSSTAASSQAASSAATAAPSTSSSVQPPQARATAAAAAAATPTVPRTAASKVTVTTTTTSAAASSSGTPRTRPSGNPFEIDIQ